MGRVLCLLAVLAASYGHATTLVLRSSATIDASASTTDEDKALAVAWDATANAVYAAGSLDFGTFKEFIVAKYSSSLVFQSSVTIRSSASGASAQASGLTVDSSGNVYAVGYIGQSSTGNDIFVAKFNSSLVLQSSATLSGTSSSDNDAGQGIALDSSGNVYVTGYVTQGAQLENIFVAKLNSSLVLQTSATINSPTGVDNDRGHGVAVDSSGNVYITGYVRDSSANGFENILVAKYNSSLVLQSSAVINTGSTDIGYGIAVDASSNVYVTGAVNGTVDTNIFVGRFNTSLVFQTSVTLSQATPDVDDGRAIALDSSGNVYVVGQTRENVGGTNIYVAQFNSSLALQSSATISTSNIIEFGYGVAVDNSGNIFAAGYAANSYTDMYVAKLSAPSSVPVLSGTGIGTSSITWSWAIDISSQTGYHVAYATNTTSYVSTSTLASSATSFTETGLSTNTAYSRVVISLEPASNSTSSAKTVYTLAAVPGNLAASQVFVSSIVLTWSANTNPAGTTYKLAYWLAGNSTTTVETTDLTTTLSSLGGGNTYYFQLYAKNGDGVLTAGTTIISTVTLSAQPTVQTVTPGTAATITYNPSPGEVTVSIPAGTYTQNVDFTVTTPGSIPAATSPLADLKGTGVAVEITPTPVLTAQSDITVTINYRDSDVTGMDENRLICARYDALRVFWVPVIDSTPDPANNRVTCRTRAFSIFQIMEATAQSTFNQAKIFPNPFIPSKGHTEVKFSNLPADSTLTIYTLNGEKLADFNASSGGLATWNARNYWGERIASGIYLIHIQAGPASKVFKLGVER
ncbi:MAG: SBBP repeat-containing protein [Elusimicrobia bacterium]|nr:SBBP repeat-containing protein [Elusimicrobiota bacterium]